MDIATIRIERSPRVVFVTLVIASATVFCSEAYSQDLVRVDGVTTQCVVNQPRQVQNPGPASAVLFPFTAIWLLQWLDSTQLRYRKTAVLPAKQCL